MPPRRLTCPRCLLLLARERVPLSEPSPLRGHLRCVWVARTSGSSRARAGRLDACQARRRPARADPSDPRTCASSRRAALVGSSSGRATASGPTPFNSARVAPGAGPCPSSAGRSAPRDVVRASRHWPSPPSRETPLLRGSFRFIAEGRAPSSWNPKSVGPPIQFRLQHGRLLDHERVLGHEDVDALREFSGAFGMALNDRMSFDDEWRRLGRLPFLIPPRAALVELLVLGHELLRARALSLTTSPRADARASSSSRTPAPRRRRRRAPGRRVPRQGRHGAHLLAGQHLARELVYGGHCSLWSRTCSPIAGMQILYATMWALRAEPPRACSGWADFDSALLSTVRPCARTSSTIEHKRFVLTVKNGRRGAIRGTVAIRNCCQRATQRGLVPRE